MRHIFRIDKGIAPFITSHIKSSFCQLSPLLHSVTHLFIYLFLSLCESQSDKRFQKTPGIYSEASTGSSEERNMNLTKWTSSSEPVALPAILDDFKNSTTVSTPLRDCQAQNTSCTAITVAESIKDRLYKQCVLWDPSCSGNITNATGMFFTRTIMEAVECIYAMSVNSTAGGDCEPYMDIKFWSDLEIWMRSLQCLSAAASWRQIDPEKNQDHFGAWGTLWRYSIGQIQTRTSHA